MSTTSAVDPLVAPVARVKSGSRAPSRNHASSLGWQMSTGVRVVGRSNPVALTFSPSSEFVIVDLPAPVDPPIPTSRGASKLRRRGST